MSLLELVSSNLSLTVSKAETALAKGMLSSGLEEIKASLREAGSQSSWLPVLDLDFPPPRLLFDLEPTLGAGRLEPRKTCVLSQAPHAWFAGEKCSPHLRTILGLCI